MAIVNGDILRVANTFLDPWGNDYVNVWYVRVVDRGGGSQVDFLEATAKHLLAIMAPVLTDAVSASYVSSYARIEKVGWNSEEGKLEVLEAYPAVDTYDYTTGSAAGDTLPAFNSMLVTFKTEGVKTFCKKFLFAPVEPKVDVDGLYSSTLTALGSFITSALSDIVFGSITDGTIRAVVHSKRAAAWVTFISGVATKYLSHQDRRKTGLGS